MTVTTPSTLTEPVDAVHAASIAAVAKIRLDTNAARRRLGLPERDYTPRKGS